MEIKPYINRSYVPDMNRGAHRHLAHVVFRPTQQNIFFVLHLQDCLIVKQNIEEDVKMRINKRVELVSAHQTASAFAKQFLLFAIESKYFSC